MKVFEFYEFARKTLKDLNEAEFLSDVNIFLEEYLRLNFTGLILNKNREITDSEFENLKKAIDLRSKNIPVQYILGHWDFMGLNFFVGDGVLIPREDTSVIVECLVSETKNWNNIKIIDLCSGSGCIAIASEKFLKNSSKIYALELSDKAFSYLSKNITSLKSNVKAIQGDIFLEYKNFQDNFFDVIVSNPPYIKTKDIKILQKEVLNEPMMALDGGKTGYDFYLDICKNWVSKLKVGGKIFFEIGIGMEENLKEIMSCSGFDSIEYKKDINGIVRCVFGTKV